MGEAIFFGLFGLIVGSFLNVLILRWGKQRVTGRSACVSCGGRIAWYDLIPVISWILLRGRCRACGAKISIQYVLVEAGTAILFVLIGLSSLPLLTRLAALPIAALLVAIAVYDLRHTLIPDAWVLTVAGLALLSSLLSLAGQETLFDVILTLFFGPVGGSLVALPLFGFWFFSHGTWMGFGDVKLALAMGWLLGIVSGLEALFLAFVLGAAIGIPLLFFSSRAWELMRARFTPTGASQKFRGRFTMKSEVPFGPFLVAATLIIWLSNMHGLGYGLTPLLGSL